MSRAAGRLSFFFLSLSPLFSSFDCFHFLQAVRNIASSIGRDWHDTLNKTKQIHRRLDCLSGNRRRVLSRIPAMLVFSSRPDGWSFGARNDASSGRAHEVVMEIVSFPGLACSRSLILPSSPCPLPPGFFFLLFLPQQHIILCWFLSEWHSVQTREQGSP